MARSKSSGTWLKEHFDDPYVKQAQADGWRSRAAYKLIEIGKKHKLFRPGQIVVDLGSAPGGWTQVAASRVGSTGRVFALDILPMDPIPDVDFIEGDFREPEPLEQLQTALAGRSVDLVLSDMAPNISGMRAVDQPRAMYLAELTLDFATEHLRKGGDMVVKIFHGEGFDAFLTACRAVFETVKIVKPDASRSRSRETYLMARGLK